MVKGLSLDEKKKRMMDFFHESQSFFQLKDVEKICSTEKVTFWRLIFYIF